MWIILELFMDRVMVSYFPIKWFSKIDFRCGDMYTVTKVKKVQYRYVRNDIKNISRQQQQSIQSPQLAHGESHGSPHLQGKVLKTISRSLALTQTQLAPEWTLVTPLQSSHTGCPSLGPTSPPVPNIPGQIRSQTFRHRPVSARRAWGGSS